MNTIFESFDFQQELQAEAGPAVATGEPNLVEIDLVEDYLDSKIVVIDDEISATQLTDLELSRQGFTNVVTFNDPLAALDWIAVEGVDVVLLDLKIPKLDGVSILKALRSKPTTKFVPIVVLTSSLDESSRIQALSAGANDYLTKPIQGPELRRRVSNALYFKNYADKIEKQITEVEKELNFDALTGLRNRRAFDEHYRNPGLKTRSKNLSLILFDIDNFKYTNDTYGHDAGDQLLKRVAEITLKHCGENDFPARFGGDEFAIVSQFETPNWPQQLAETIRKEVEETQFHTVNGIATTTLSFGISIVEDLNVTKGELFEQSDCALYVSKKQGRNRTTVFSKTETQIARESMPLSAEQPAVEGEIDPRSATVLIIDDESTVSDMVKLHLNSDGFSNVHTENKATQAIDRIHELMPDLVITDIRMPNVNGLDILKSIKSNQRTAAIPVLVMTSSSDQRVRLAALKLQASDFLTKPCNVVELRTRALNAIQLKLQHDQLVNLSAKLNHEVKVRTAELFSTRREAIHCLARAAEARDAETGNHVIRVGRYAAIIGRQMGMSDDQVGWLELAAQLHDVGKLSIPDAILLKPGKLTPDERRVIETHCQNADRIFFGNDPSLEKMTISSPLLKMASRIAISHHERWDGTGYPNGLSGADIPLEGRITAVADVFDALSSSRPYKAAICPIKSCQMIVDSKGTHFDPKVIDAFVRCAPAILAAHEKWKDN